MEIQIELREVYGRTVAYPVNNNAGRLADIAGTKTLTLRHLEMAAQMGMQVVEKYGRDWTKAA